MKNTTFKSQYTVTPRSERKVVRGDQRRQPMRAVQTLQQLEHGPSILLVQISGGFIGQQHGRSRDERPSDCHALLFPSGKLSGAVFRPIF
jgi:hypothetical protein